MFERSLFWAGKEAPVVLRYQSREAALRDPVLVGSADGDGTYLRFDDDYGRVVVCVLPLADVVTDVERERESAVEIAIINARAQAKVQTQAQADPVLWLMG